ncbi:MAG TPA: PD-(D/E)XK nuclease family protein [Thermoplasmata archaeon]|nr:PD-(D/E)XK nuclease family protein [Thermoplasmata archaeon]
MNEQLLLALVIALVGTVVLVAAAVSIARRREDLRFGDRPVVDLPSRPSPVLRSERWRLAGRPDEIVQRPDGRWVPIEVKSRASPSGEPPLSHRAQVAAYCLLLEETTGRSPPYGILRYSDGRTFEVPWDAGTRDWLWRIRCELDRVYDGRANPSRGRCYACRWREICDRRAS